MRETKALLVLDLLRVKNFVKDVVKNPKRIIIYLLQFVGYIFILIPVIINRGKTFDEISTIKVEILNSAVIGLMLLMVFANLFSSLKQPGIVLGSGDVTFLLASPIRERTVFLWHMIRDIFKNLFTPVLLVIYLPFLSFIMKVSAYSHNLILAYWGVFTLFLTLGPLRFLFYSLSMKFNAKELIKYVLWGVLVVILGSAGYFAYKEQNVYGLIEFFNLKVWDYVPVVGPSKGLIISYFTGNSHNAMIQIISQVFTIGFLVFMALYFATDYYEEVAAYTETIRRIKEKVGKGDFSDDVNQKAKKKIRKVEMNFAPKGPWVFVWLKMVENKRRAGSIFFNLYNLFLLVISVLFGYFIPKDDSTIIFFLVFWHAYMTWILSVVSAIAAELHKMYIYIIPGEGLKKLVAVNLVSLLKSSITVVLLIVPASIFIKPGLLNTVAAIMFMMSFAVLQNFSYAFLITFMPAKEDITAATVFFRWFGLLFLLIPVGLVSIPLGIAVQSVGIGVLSASVVMLLEAGVLLLFANSIFERLELK